jgi:hypothetical protein
MFAVTYNTLNMCACRWDILCITTVFFTGLVLPRSLWTFMLIGVAFFVSGYDFGEGGSWDSVCTDFSSCFGYVCVTSVVRCCIINLRVLGLPWGPEWYYLGTQDGLTWDVTCAVVVPIVVPMCVLCALAW